MRTTRTRLMSLSRLVLATVVCLGGPGCSSNPTTEPSGPAVSTSSDEQVLLALDYYEPMYQLNGEGRVIKLRLTQRHLPVAVLAEVGKLTELQALDVYGATVTDDGLAQLKDLQKLRHFGLGGTAITDKGLAHLEKLQSLQWLWIPKHRTTDEGVDKLKQARPDLNIYPQ